jgi:hypothetical protein
MRIAIIAVLAVTVIIIATSAATTITKQQQILAFAATASRNNNNNNDTALCFDGDAADETYWVGYVDAINDFHHIKRYGITAFFDPQAEADYHRGYQAGWASAQVNGTTIDKDCFDTRLGN